MSYARIDMSDSDADTETDADTSAGATATRTGVPDDGPAVEVRGVYRGVVTNARILVFPSKPGRHASGTRMLVGGVALAVASLVMFLVSAVGAGVEIDAYERWQARGNPPQDFPWTPRSAGRDVLIVMGLLGGGVLAATGLKRRGKTSPHFTVGSEAGVDAPIASEFVRWPAHPLVQAAGGDYVVNATPRMTGTVDDRGRVYSLADFTQKSGTSFPLPPSGSTQLDCGATTFVITRTGRPRALPSPRFTWNAKQHGIALASGLALALCVVLLSFLPPDPRALSLDLMNTDGRFVKFQIKPPEVIAEPIIAPVDPKRPGAPSGARGDKGPRIVGEEGQMGSRSSKASAKLDAIKGPEDTVDPHRAKALAAARAANAGILGVLNSAESAQIAAVFGGETAIGRAAENFMGGLLGTQMGDAYGINGWGVIGTGDRGGGTNEGLIGRGGGLGTFGKAGGGDHGTSYGVGVGQLRQRAHVIAPDPMPGIVVGRGSLDKEIVRRIIRRHINEVRFCYEQELVKNPDLGGRIMVQFTISGSGQVISSVVQNSTMGNIRVESCTTQAVRRWEFPKPVGGGLVIVSYPFVLAAAGH